MNTVPMISAQNPANVPQPRLVQAAHEFEAQLMKEILKPMMSASGIGGDDPDGGSGGALADFATEALGQSLSKHGGLGIATSILRDLSRNGKDPGRSSSLGNEVVGLSFGGIRTLK